MADETLKINPRRIVHETIDDEVIIIDLETGAYFSLTGSAADLWPALVKGTSRAGLMATWAGAFDAPASEIEASVTAFLDELKTENIITVESGGPAAPAEPASAAVRPRRLFEPPKLAKYTNMSDLLLLDPIHDVDEQGWPRKKPD